MSAALTRRAVLSSLAAGTVAGGVSGASALPLVEIYQTEIERLFAEWLHWANEADTSAYEDNWSQCPYVLLQAQIMAQEPTNAHDLAIQSYVDTDQFGSEPSATWEARIARLVGAEPLAPASENPVPTTVPCRPELPVEKIRRLGREMAKALAEFNADACDRWVVHIHPQGSMSHPVWLENVNAMQVVKRTSEQHDHVRFPAHTGAIR